MTNETSKFGVYLTEEEVNMTNILLEKMQDRAYAMEGGLTPLVEVLTRDIALLSIALECPHMG